MLDLLITQKQEGILLISTMDPYVKIIMGGQVMQSSVHEKGGKAPSWNQVSNYSDPQSQEDN